MGSRQEVVGSTLCYPPLSHPTHGLSLTFSKQTDSSGVSAVDSSDLNDIDVSDIYDPADFDDYKNDPDDDKNDSDDDKNDPASDQTDSDDEVAQNMFITHTFSECVENHKGMETVGDKRATGFAEAHLREMAEKYAGAVVHDLEDSDLGTEPAIMVVFPGAVDRLSGLNAADNLLAESLSKSFDDTYLNQKKTKGRGQLVVQNKHGRVNNCYADVAQTPNISEVKGTIHACSDAPCMAMLRGQLPKLLGDEAADLYAETNKYMDVSKSKVGIGFHGDSERSIVVGVRLGLASGKTPLRFQWYYRNEAVSAERVIELNHGDMYAMSSKATGCDWMYSSKITLRHGTGLKARVREVIDISNIAGGDGGRGGSGSSRRKTGRGGTQPAESNEVQNL